MGHLEKLSSDNTLVEDVVPNNPKKLQIFWWLKRYVYNALLQKLHAIG